MVSRTLPLQREMQPQEAYRLEWLSPRSPGTPRLQLGGHSLPVQRGMELWPPMEECQATTRCVAVIEGKEKIHVWGREEGREGERMCWCERGEGRNDGEKKGREGKRGSSILKFYSVIRLLLIAKWLFFLNRSLTKPTRTRNISTTLQIFRFVHQNGLINSIVFLGLVTQTKIFIPPPLPSGTCGTIAGGHW